MDEDIGSKHEAIARTSVNASISDDERPQGALNTPNCTTSVLFFNSGIAMAQLADGEALLAPPKGIRAWNGLDAASGSK